MEKNILIIYNEKLQAQSLKDKLTDYGFYVKVAVSFAQARDLLNVKMSDSILLDSKSTDIPIQDACKFFRNYIGKHQIVVLGTITDNEEEIKTAGANFFLTKPYRFNNLLHYLQEQSHYSVTGNFFSIGTFRFYPINRQLIDADGCYIALTEKETAILIYLYHVNGNIVSRNELLSEVWGYSSNVSTHTLETHVYCLRRKLIRDQNIIISKEGGYLLNKSN
ncbi:MAG: response regulator transcription factor [Rhodospirillaceae bacterium]|jgi:DNA-binding response OmpR family regulator|nr:response regulator transcription factor [Rhodospirillaceae bacterium]